MVKPPSPGPAASATPAAKAAPSPAERSKPLRPPPPGPVQMPKDSELQRYLASLQRRVHTGRRRSWWLALAAAGLLLVSLVSWWAYYASSVLAYAELEEAIRVERIAEDPDRVALWYQPGTAGLLGFRRVDADRETELLDEVVSEAVGKEQRFEWRWSGVQEGSRVKVTYREGWRLAQRELQVPAAPSRPPLGDAVLQGEIVNATTNRPLEGAEIRIVGTPLSAKSGADGRFRLTEAPSGPVPIEISAANFSTDQLERELVSGKETPLRVALSPGMKSGQIRLVLTWAKQPADLDAHLEGPLPESKRFHIYFQEKGDLKSREFVNLDVDDRDGEGPETITVLGVLPGVYHYFVHDYTNRDATESQSLARSGAEVKVYQGGQTYRFRTNDRSIGNIWKVCDIEVIGETAVVRKIDQYESKRMKRSTAGTVVLLIDVSGSMTSLIHTTKQAAHAFLKAVPFEGGAKAGLATFGIRTGKLCDITNDRQTLDNAIEPLRVDNGTPLTEGLRAVHEMLKNIPDPRTVVVFTDGEPDNSMTALEEAGAIKRDKIVLWAIGTTNANMSLLKQLVSSPDKALFASPNDLREIFGQAAGKIYAPIEEPR